MRVAIKKRSRFENYKFSLAAWIILIHKTLESFCFYGTQGILTIYFNLYLRLDEKLSTILYHLYAGLAFLTPILGAVVDENYFGRIKTLFIFEFVYLLGLILMAVTAFWKNIPGPLIAMAIICLGSGSSRSSISALGGDQIPVDNKKMVQKFFSLYYTLISVGAMIAVFLLPILRKSVSYIEDQCYPLAFGVPAVIFLLNYILIISGKNTYNVIPLSKHVLSSFIHCIFLGLLKYFKSSNKNKNTKAYIDYAYPEYSLEFIADCKLALRTMLILVPTSIFWTLYYQQGSRWTLQAKLMDRSIGKGFIIKPEQIQLCSSLFVILLIPIFNFIIYPLLKILNILIKPTSRILCSYFVIGFSFLLSATLNVYVISGQKMSFTESGSKILILNAIPSCRMNFTIHNQSYIFKPKDQFIIDLHTGFYKYRIQCNGFEDIHRNITLNKFRMKSIIVHNINNSLVLITKDVSIPNGYTNLRFIGQNNKTGRGHIFMITERNNIRIGENYSTIDSGYYDVYYKNISNSTKLEIKSGLIGSFMIDGDNRIVLIKEFEPKLVHLLWQIPQYIFVSSAEILCSITSIAYAYSESPKHMKSVMQAFYLFTIFSGNMIISFITSLGIIHSQTLEFLFYAALALIAAIVNWLLIRIYQV